MSQANKTLKNLYYKNSLTQINWHKKPVYIISDETPFYASFPASLTVEAAISVPIFLCFVVVLLFFFFVMRTQMQVQSALNQTGRILSEYACTKEVGEETERVRDQLLFIRQIRERDVRTQDIVGGMSGLVLSQITDDPEYVELQVSYHIKLPIGLFGNIRLPVRQQVKVRKWIGDSGITGDSQWVYITKNGEVYHRTKSCSYLDLRIQTISAEEIKAARNKSGGKYKACGSCRSQTNTGIFYITDYGEGYHWSLACHGLTRSIQRIRLEEVGSRRACRKCGGEG